MFCPKILQSLWEKRLIPLKFFQDTQTHSIRNTPPQKKNYFQWSLKREMKAGQLLSKSPMDEKPDLTMDSEEMESRHKWSLN